MALNVKNKSVCIHLVLLSFMLCFVFVFIENEPGKGDEFIFLLSSFHSWLVLVCVTLTAPCNRLLQLLTVSQAVWSAFKCVWLK